MRLAIQSQFHSDLAIWREERNYMRTFSPAKRASPVANAGSPEKQAGPASRADSCNRKDENTYTDKAGVARFTGLVRPCNHPLRVILM